MKVLDDPNGCGLLLLVVILALVVTLAKLQSDRSKLLGADSTTPTGGSLVVIIGSLVDRRTVHSVQVHRKNFVSRIESPVAPDNPDCVQIEFTIVVMPRQIAPRHRRKSQKIARNVRVV